MPFKVILGDVLAFTSKMSSFAYELQGLKYCDITLFLGLWTVVMNIGNDLLCHIALFLDYTLDFALYPPTQKVVLHDGLSCHSSSFFFNPGMSLKRQMFLKLMLMTIVGVGW